MQFGAGKKPPQGIVYDSDLGNSIDTALALALLHGSEAKNFGKLAAISISKSNIKAAQFADVIEKFYASKTQPGSQGGIGPLLVGSTIGLAVDGKMPADTPILNASFGYESSIRKLNDTAIVEALIRNALTAQYDGNAVVVLSGPATNLIHVLDLPGAKEVVAAKVRVLAMVSSNTYFQTDIKAARRLLAEWPTPIVLCGREVGAALPFPASSIDQDFAYAPNHPIPAAYRAFQAMPYDAPASAMAAALYAVRPDEDYFKLSAPGTMQIADDGSSTFKESPAGKHRYLIVDPAQKERVIKAYTEMASSKPVPRVRRPFPVDADKAADKAADKVEEKPEKKPQ